MHRIWVRTDDLSLRIAPEGHQGLDVELLADPLGEGVTLTVSEYGPPVLDFWGRLRRSWRTLHERRPCLTSNRTELTYRELRALANWVRRRQQDEGDGHLQQLTLGVGGDANDTMEESR